MISRFAPKLAQISGQVPEQSPGHEHRAFEEMVVPNALLIIDDAIFVLGIGLFLILLIQWTVRGCKDPLRLAPQRPNRLREHTFLWAVVVYMLVLSSAITLLGISKDDNPGIVSLLIAGSMAQLAGIIACLVIGYLCFDNGLTGFLRGNSSLRIGHLSIAVPAGLLLSLSLCPLILNATLWIWHGLVPNYVFEPHATIESLRDPMISPILRWGLWLATVGLAPVAEELFFRGLVQTTALNLLKRRWVAILLASVAFAAVHIGQGHTMPALFVLGIILGYGYERTGSLIPPIAVHALFNLKTLVWEALSHGPTTTV